MRLEQVSLLVDMVAQTTAPASFESVQPASFESAQAAAMLADHSYIEKAAAAA